MEVYFPQHVFEKIFNYIKDPRELLQLSRVHVSWKNYIDNLDIWKKLCSEEDIYPWKYQLIKMRYPFMENRHYRNLTFKKFKDVVILYLQWCSLLQSGTEKIQGYFNLAQSDIDIDTLKYNCDSLDNYLAVGIYFTGLINLYNLKTGKGEMEPIAFKDHIEDLNTYEIFPSGGIKIKIWRTDDGKIILVIYMNYQILLWNVEEKRKYKTPEIFLTDARKSLYLSQGFNNDVFIINQHNPRKLSVLQLELSDDDEIIANEILNIHVENYLAYTYKGLCVKNRKIMLIYLLHPQPTEGPDISMLAVTIIKIPRLLSEPITISVNDNNYTTTVFHDSGFPVVKFFIPTFKLLMAYHEKDRKIRVIVLKTSRRGLKPAVVEEADYELPDNISKEIVSYLHYFANFLIITTKQGNIFIYELEDVSNLFDIQFESLPMVKIFLNEAPIRELKMTQIDGMPNLIVPTKNSLVYFLRMN
ncbi:uncharacterized protein LOC130675597 [Microplitis mediator]|uniref:uncharacterized protein LOC130675597 n=1 Tax=Microplitis mediator TaxID=375433 RepID=UPI0025535E11|nr:uncharacterized protein LOC130675597 [Microplitis mediator]